KPDSKRVYTLGKVRPGEEYYISTEVLVAEDAPDGKNVLKVRLYRGDFQVVDNIPIMTRSRDIELNLANLRTQPAELRPDSENNEMKVQLVNNGKKTAENVVINLNLPESFEPISSFSDRQALGNMAPGEVKEASFLFDIGPNASKGKIHVPGTITYTSGDSSSEVRKSVGFDVYLSGIPQYKVEVIDGSFGPDDERIKLRVGNTGNVQSESTRLRAMGNSERPFSFDSANQYIGTLEVNKSGTAVFDISVDDGAPKKDYLVDFEVRGVKDERVFVEEKTVELTLNGNESGTGYLNWLVIPMLIVVFVAGAVAHRKNLF
ncbi:MAG: COG1361 S-layer family protein, partial [Candidatus Aenigmatarchaeota archaeon]